MQILGSSFQIAVPEQKLDGAQIGSGFQQMGCPAVANQMGCHRRGIIDARLQEFTMSGRTPAQKETACQLSSTPP